MSRARPCVVAVAVVASLTAACVAPEDEGTTYDDVSALATALTAAGLPCELEYEGLADGDREVSTCTIEGEFVLLQVWDDPELLQQFLDVADPPTGGRATGPSWVVEVESGALAQRVADVLGGTVDG